MALFYQGERPATQVGPRTLAIIWQGHTALAQQVEEVELLQTDAAGSVLSVVGQSAAFQAFTPYGYRLRASVHSAIGFNGYRQDPVTGTYPLGNGHRYYGAALMRFISPDAFSPFHRGGMNAYAYCQGDPINREDSNGRWPNLRKQVFGGRTGLSAALREHGLPKENLKFLKGLSKPQNRGKVVEVLKPGRDAGRDSRYTFKGAHPGIAVERSDINLVWAEGRFLQSEDLYVFAPVGKSLPVTVPPHFKEVNMSSLSLDWYPDLFASDNGRAPTQAPSQNLYVTDPTQLHARVNQLRES